MLSAIRVNEPYVKPCDIQNEIRDKVYAEQSKYKQRYGENRLVNVKFNISNIVYTHTRRLASALN